MMKFVLLHHDTTGSALDRASHWDFMIELPDVEGDRALRTWALASEPRCGERVSAIELPLHRRMYLDFEGPLSGNRGLIRQLDDGTYEQLESVENSLELRVEGKKMTGKITIGRNDVSSYFLFMRSN